MKKSMSSIAVIAALANATLFAGTWFDAGIAGYGSWPADGAEQEVPGVGVWRGTAFAELSGSVGAAELVVSAPKEKGLTFDFSDSVAAGATNGTVTTTLTLAVADAEEPFPKPASPCALTSVRVGEAEAAFFGLVLDAEGGTNAWRRLTGAIPRDGVVTTLGFSLKPGDGVSLVRYSVDGEALTLNGEVWLPMAPEQEGVPTDVSSVCYSGLCQVTALGATFGEEREPVVDLEVPVFVSDGTALRLDGEPGTTGARFSMTIANPVEGAYYTVFTSETLDGTFAAEADSTPYSGAIGAYTIAVEADKPTKFARVVVSAMPFKKGDCIPSPLK